MPIEKFGWNKKSLVGFAWHEAMGALCFLFDIAVIYFLIHKLHLHYAQAVAIGFICATFLNYSLTRLTIYANTERSHDTALMYFFIVAACMLIITVSGTVFLREVLHVPLYIARAMIGIVIGFLGYLIDCVLIFKLR